MPQEKQRGVQYGTILGAARLGDRASIGNGYWMSAHGGAVRPRVQCLLDSMNSNCSLHRYIYIYMRMDQNV